MVDKLPAVDKLLAVGNLRVVGSLQAVGAVVTEIGNPSAGARAERMCRWKWMKTEALHAALRPIPAIAGQNSSQVDPEIRNEMRVTILFAVSPG